MHAHPASIETAFPGTVVSAGPEPPVADDASGPPQARPPTGDAPPVTVGAIEHGWSARLLRPRSSADWKDDARRFATGIGLAGIYGLALGTRDGGAALVTHAAGVPAALLAASALGVPALGIVLALFDAPVSLDRLGAAMARAAATTGLVLAGLAPAVALYVVSSDGRLGAILAGAAGLFFAGAVGLGRMVRDLGATVSDAPASTRASVHLVLACFAFFTVALVARVWWTTLPILGGGR